MASFHLGIDIQTLFTFEKTRGIGRYTFHLIKSLADKTSDNFKITLFSFNPTPPEEVVPLLNNRIEYRPFKIPQSPQKFLEYGISAPLLWSDVASDLDWFLVTSPLLHNILLPDLGPCRIATILYDLIPYLCQGSPKTIDIGFLRQGIYPPHLWERYLARLEHIKSFDFFFSISDSTKKAFEAELDIPENKIQTLYCGLGDCFTKKQNQEISERLEDKLNLPERYILTVTGFNFRKNIEGGIRVFSKLLPKIRRTVKYVIQCSLNDEEIKIVEGWVRKYKVEGQVIISGGTLEEEDLTELYRGAEIFFFPSFYEGLGLPVLESMACGVPVVTSDTGGLSEVVLDAGIKINPQDEDAFASAIESLLNNKGEREKFRQAGFERIKNFSWDNASQTIISSLSSFKDDKLEREPHTLKYPESISEGKKIKLAYFSPHNPLPSGISDYSESLLNELRKYFEIDLFVEDYIPTSNNLLTNHNLFSFRDYNYIAREQNYALNIFHIGNNSLHKIIYKMLRAHPGIVVMHEFSLCGFFREGLNTYFNFAEIWDKLQFEPLVDTGENYPPNLINFLNNLSPKEIPFLKDIVISAKRIIVHSNWLKEKIITWREQAEAKKCLKPANKDRWAEIDVIPMGADAPPEWTKNESKTIIRKKWNIPEDAFVVAVVGTINRFKRLEVVLRAFDFFRKRHPNPILAISGTFADIEYYREIRQQIEWSKMDFLVRFFGYLEMDDLIRLILASDVCVNLRFPTLGEMSGIIPRILALERPLIVSEVDSFKELPDDCCIKVVVGGGEAEELASLFKSLSEKPELRIAMGKCALRFVESCTWKKTAERYRETIEKALSDTKTF